jgi:hypothetical protein
MGGSEFGHALRHCPNNTPTRERSIIMALWYARHNFGT